VTISEKSSVLELECDDCGVTTQNTTMTDLLVNSAMAKWKVFTDPDHGVQHFCQVCGQKSDHELAWTLRQELQNNGISVPMDLGDEESTGFGFSLDDEVEANAKARAGRLVPDMGAVDAKVKEKGEYSFGFSLEDDENGK
jgi:hypothetical protein